MSMINFIDENSYSLIIKLMSMGMTKFMLFISYLGSATALIILTIGFIILLKNKTNSTSVAINLILVFLLNRLLKIIIARPRPEVLKIVQEKGYSFPSGHTMVSTGFYGFLIYLIYKNIKSKKIKYPLIVTLAILILLIGISRVYLGAHYATDVIGGWIIGTLYLAFFIKYAYKKILKKSKKVF